jgi:GNAT superfamily N-acetyltransferase|tara:strand:- start:8406 stop:8888 length:483 start_codon:yes stop_codon:yes gene_type:complete
MDVEIRKAVKTDAEGILALIQELATFEQEPDALILDKKNIEEDRFGSNPLFNCFVAVFKSKIIGMALFYPRYSTWKGATLHLEDLVVTEKMKGKGIGTKLYKAFLSHADSLGVDRVEWVVLDWNTTAIQFYEKSGAKVLSDWNIVQMDQSSIKNYILENK